MYKHPSNYYNSLRQNKNHLLTHIPKALALAKKTSNPKIRSAALNLYFRQKRDLVEVEQELCQS